MKQVQGTYALVVREDTVSGPVERLHTIEGPALPWRISKRLNQAQRSGVDLAKALRSVPGHVVIAFSVVDGLRALRSWKRLEHQPGFTGTDDVHPLISRTLTK